MEPMVQEMDWPSPGVLASWVGQKPHRLWFDSALAGHAHSQVSILTGDPLARLVVEAGGEAWAIQDNIKDKLSDPWATLETWLGTIPAADCQGEGFWGGLVGFRSYESYGDEFKFKPRRVDPGLPSVYFLFVDTGLRLDHRTQRAQIFSWGLNQVGGKPSKSIARQRCEALAGELETIPKAKPMDAMDSPIEIKCLEEKSRYLKKVGKIREAIFAGDFYQVNLSHKFQVQGAFLAPELYLKLRKISSAPQMAFVNLGDCQILSASPEILLETDQGTVGSYPIKGTRPRNFSESSDQVQGEALLDSEKDGAELLMIVDLVRNDLGKVCQVGSIRVPQLKYLDSFPQVHHLVSCVEGRLAKGATPLMALNVLFPGGSITGAPKLKAMEWINELEDHPRGIYTGSIGYVSFNQSSCFNIAIRTAVLREGSLEYHAGGGIVADSDPEAEYQETLDKTLGFLQALDKGFEDIQCQD